MSNIGKVVAEKLAKQRLNVLASLEAVLSALYDQECVPLSLNKNLQEIVDLCFDVLSSPHYKNKNAERAGELLASECVSQSDILGDVQHSLAASAVEGLSSEEIIWVQPRLSKTLADIANGYCRMMRQTLLTKQENIYYAYVDQIEKSRAELSELRTDMDSFVSVRTKEFMETNLKLEKEISEHKKARAALVDSERRYRTLAESAHDYIFIINENDQIEYLNKFARELFKSTHKNVIGHFRSELFDHQSNETQKKSLRHVFDKAIPLHRQEWTTNSNGVKFFLDTRLVPLIDNGKVYAVMGISRDLTEQKVVEEKIVDREKKYHTLFDTMQSALFLIDAEKIIDCNQSSTLIFDLSRDQMVGRYFSTLFCGKGQTQNSVKKLITENLEFCISGDNQHFELDYIRPDKETITCEVHFSRFPESDKWQVLAAVRNITPYKKANDAIRASESRFRDIVRRSIDGYFFIDVNYHITHLNRSGERILTYSKEEMNERSVSKLDEEWNIKLRRVLKQAMGGKPFAWEEFYFIDKNGKPRWVAANVRRVYDKGVVLGVEGFIKDITDRKMSEIELVENEARYRALFESTPYDVFGLTRDRHFLKVNQNFQQNWGRFEGRKIQSLRPQALARLITELCDNVDISKKTLEASFTQKKKDQIKYFRLIMAPIITEKETLIGYAGLIIDTTDTVQALSEKMTFAEKLVQTSEEEQRRISRDIHDSLGQMLFALQLDISSAKSNLRKDINRAEQILENSETKLSICMKEASSICYQLSPRLLDDFGLVEALEDLVEKIKTTSPLQINMTKKWSRRKKNKSLETALFRVAQEALANILRHSGASHVFIRLFEEENGITFSIADDGKGFDLFTQKRGFGLMNMKERIEIIGGQFEIETAPHKGTKIEVWLPPLIKDHNE